MQHCFQVYPEHCNPLEVDGKMMVHGGAMLTQMDRVVAIYVQRLLVPTDCDEIRTVNVKVNFLAPAKLGDLVDIEMSVKRYGRTSIAVLCNCTVGDNHISSGEITFVSFKSGKVHPHGLTGTTD